MKPMDGCRICGSRALERLYALPAGDILRCRECATMCRENLVGGEAAVDLYEDDAYLDTPYFEALKVGAPRDVEPYLVYRRVLARLPELLEGASGRRLLDVGCSYGAFLELARDGGWEPFGVELSSKAAEYARRQRALPVVTGTLEQAAFPGDHFAAVTLWDVIEHLDDPLGMLRELRRILAPGGVLVLFTINQRSLINRVGHLLYRASLGTFTRPLALLYDIHHNFFFDPATLGALLRRSGLGDRVEIDWLEANVERWQNVPIPPLLALGSKALDVASRVLGQPYRMIVYTVKSPA